MKKQKSLMKQLLEAKTSNDEEQYEDLYLEVSEQIESVCHELQNDCSDDRDSIMLMIEILKRKANDLEEYAADLK